MVQVLEVISRVTLIRQRLVRQIRLIPMQLSGRKVRYVGISIMSFMQLNVSPNFVRRVTELY